MSPSGGTAEFRALFSEGLMGMGDVHGSPFAESGPRRSRPATLRPTGKFPHPFLPTCRADLDARGWDEVDIVIVSGDAHVDHAAFGPVPIARSLEGRRYQVGLRLLTIPDEETEGRDRRASRKRRRGPG